MGVHSYLPFPTENLDSFLGHIGMLSEQRRSDGILKFTQEAFSPKSECLGIMTANIFYLFNDERSLRLTTDVIQDLSDGWEVAAGEDVLVDKTRAVSKLVTLG